VIDRTQMNQIGAKLRAQYPSDENVVSLGETIHRIARITGELQDEIMKARMLPIDGVFQRFPRMVRDLAQKTGKDVDFQMLGGETELDRSVLECIGDPIIHLLRNSLDHGVEAPGVREAAGKPRRGRVVLSASHQENHIVIAVSDDGHGIDPAQIKAVSAQKGIITEAQADRMTDKDALNLIFASGLSTAKQVSEISGRGVGMDIVKSNIEKLGGQIFVESAVGRGSTFTIRLPLTLAILRALLVQAGGGCYVLPLSSVLEMLRLGDNDGHVTRRSIHGQAAMVLRGKTVPLASLTGLLVGDPLATTTQRVPENAYIVVVGFGQHQVGLAVDRLLGQQEAVIKSLGSFLGDIPGVSGATILGDGQVALIVDVPRAVDLVRSGAEPASSAVTEARERAHA
ncbi:MAG TPA: chemotaxis protein CheA, partial [Capsulimonadaceae bacterium]|nr:chemotaxis protein CheA [Capsulimonadaceae bacterium]